MMHKDWICCADTHGDKRDKRAARMFLKHVELLRPKIRIHAGDWIDARALRNGASEEEKRDSIRRDYAMGMEFLETYRPTHLTEGNHDVRLYDTAERGGPLADYCKELIAGYRKTMEQLGCRIYPYNKRRGIARIGKMKFAHGFFHGPTAARQMALAFGSVMFGHGHAIDVASTPSSDRRAGRMIGCLCRLDMTYNRAHVGTLRQAHGWVYGPLFGNGNYQVFQAEMIGGKVTIAENVKVLSA